jgi:hypothetical protein
MSRRQTLSDIEADLRRAATAYWAAIANKGGAERTAALLKARRALREARAAGLSPDGAKQPAINGMEAPVQEAVRSKRLNR